MWIASLAFVSCGLAGQHQAANDAGTTITLSPGETDFFTDDTDHKDAAVQWFPRGHR